MTADFLERTLDTIEDRETGLLVWGAVDGYFTQAELEDLIDPALNVALDNHENVGIYDGLAVIKEMVRRGWLMSVPQPDHTVRYRSRMAETVRLLARLRQLFPQHGRTPNGWQLAPTLVVDFRFQRRQRQYPRRNIQVAEVLRDIGAVTNQARLLDFANEVLSSSAAIRAGGLSSFQVRAAQRILKSIDTKKPSSTIVCAGTGSGKTLAFYLPALSTILHDHATDADERPWVKAISIYPRNELLKDQLREIFFRVRGLSPVNGRRRLRIGAFYGDVPGFAGRAMNWPRAWIDAGPHKVCPFLRCPDCGADLLWREEDFTALREKLVCRVGCGFSTDEYELALTRESQSQRPPDLLFTTTETLNRQLTSPRFCHLFGVGPRALRPPHLVLLDEVHTYDSRHGAQVAYLLRRWQQLVGSQLRFVGLSATLRDAVQFFADLVGCRLGSVAEIVPRPEEMESEGAEYMVAVRGDPVSRSALLSTTIQAAMLVQRCLDRPAAAGQQTMGLGLYGTRTFAFTDNLDSINRLYFNLLDAEGRDSRGAPDLRNAPNGGLAVLRQPGPSRGRYLAGQDWRACTDLQHNLATRLVVSRVSSQDRGVNASADVVVATAALEVGFDDPSVGAIVQHKAPRNMASFLQRKGRAGRTRGMRPWSVVVLSDYGRDRIAYQAYDQLFDPELPIRFLPLRSRYVQRMQATYATLDYLSTRMPATMNRSLWNCLSGKPETPEPQRRMIAHEIRALIESDGATAGFAEYLGSALQLSADDVSSLLWEYPRPLMTTVLPTALRRLETNWRGDFPRMDSPLPEFVPSSLFEDLTLPEVRIELQRLRQPAGTEHFMAFFAAIAEFAPGRISRRFGIDHELDRDWVAPPANVLALAPSGDIELDLIGETCPIGIFQVRRPNGLQAIPVYQPIAIKPTRPPAFVGDTSNSQLRWNTQFHALGEGRYLGTPPESVGSAILRGLTIHLHAQHMPVEVRRFAMSCDANMTLSRVAHAAQISFVKDGLPAGIGAAFAVDGVAFDMVMPAALWRIVTTDNEISRALRTLRFSDDAWRGRSLNALSNPFQRDWLAQIQISAVSAEAVTTGTTLRQAAAAVHNGSAVVGRSSVLAAIFMAQVVDDAGVDLNLFGDDRLRRDLQALLNDPAVQAELNRMSARLWEPIDAGWEPWLREIFSSTLAAGILRAIQDLCPNLDVENLVVDVEPNEGAAADAECKVWVTERGPGGNGQIEQFVASYAENPRRFYSMIRASLEMGELELVDDQLSRLAAALTDDAAAFPQVNDSATRLRTAAGHQEMAAAVLDLRRGLSREGFIPFHGMISAALSRLFRPNSQAMSDRYLNGALRQWGNEEQRLGIEIDLRVVSYWLSQSKDIDEIARASGLEVGNDAAAWRMSAVYGLLWGRGRTIREASLRHYNQFTPAVPIERLLVVRTLVDRGARIWIGAEDWFELTSDLLSKGRLVTLYCAPNERELLAAALNALICNPIESDYLRAFARVQGVRVGRGAVFEADVEMIEAVQ